MTTSFDTDTSLTVTTDVSKDAGTDGIAVGTGRGVYLAARARATTTLLSADLAQVQVTDPRVCWLCISLWRWLGVFAVRQRVWRCRCRVWLMVS